MVRGVWVVAALVAGGGGWSVAANDPPTEPTRLELYETATVVARPIEDATAAVTVLDRDAIEALGASTIGDLVRQLVGLDLTTNGSPAGISTAQIRGGDPNFTLVLVDGVPLNDATDLFGGSVNLSSLPTAHVERVEVVRGPVSSFYGSTGLAGAIHIFTKKPESAGSMASFAAGAGNASFHQASASLSSSAESTRYFLGAAWVEEHGRIADESFEEFQLQGNLGVAIGPRVKLDLTGRIAAWEGNDYPDASGGPVYGTGETRFSEHEELSLGTDWTIGQARGGQRVSAKVYRHELERTSPGVPPSVPPSEEQTEYTHLQAGWTLPVHRSDAVNLSVGLALDREDGTNDSTLFLPPEFGGPIDGSYRIDRTTGAALVDFTGQHGRLVYEASARVDVPEDFGTEISPRAGVRYRFGEHGPRVRASIGRAFKLPSFFVLASPPALGGNPDLEPEIALGADLGVEQAFAGNRVTVSGTLFAYRFEDLVDFDFDTFRFVNRSEVTSRGAEGTFDWRPSDKVDVHANLTYQDVENRDTGETLRQRPRWVGGGRAVWQALPRLSWELDGQGVSDRLDEQIPVPQIDTVDGYILFGTALTWRASAPWVVTARIDNLADEEYETLIGFPGAGRAYRLSLRYDLGVKPASPSASSAASRSEKSSSSASGPAASSTWRGTQPVATATAR
jgi:outer membrane cobalamin receptor